MQAYENYDVLEELLLFLDTLGKDYRKTVNLVLIYNLIFLSIKYVINFIINLYFCITFRKKKIYYKK